MTQNKYTNWNVVAVVVHVVYKENKKSVKTDLKILMMRMIFFHCAQKSWMIFWSWFFLNKKKAKIFFFWWFYTATWCGASSGGPGGGCGGPLGADAGVDIAVVGVASDGSGGTSAPSTQLFNFFAEGSLVLSSNVATSPAASMGLLVGSTAATAGGDKFFRSVVLSFSLEFWNNVNKKCKQSASTNTNKISQAMIYWTLLPSLNRLP